jgi:glutamate N-acetyltransferase / amino-acid N-acetyltransferase
MAARKRAEHDNRYLRPAAGGITAARGFTASACKAGIKSSGGPDAALLLSEAPCASAGTFTTNRVRASSVKWCERLLPSPGIRGVFCNSGNANACTGKRGASDTAALAAGVAGTFGGKAQSVLIASTGVIGKFLPLENITAKIPLLSKTLSAKGGRAFAEAIMTTDTIVKECAYEVGLGKKSFVMGGCTKGSGMICPNMATMLCFITTDAAIDKGRLNGMVKRVVDRTFNNLTVDGDTSTNDMVLVLANGASGARVESPSDLGRFEECLFTVCNKLCMLIAADGEGATKRVEVNITGAKTGADAKLAAKAIANSNLVKTALFGNDPNWGRIICAVGYSGARFSEEKILVKLCGTEVFRAMRPTPFPEKALHKKLAGKVVAIDADLGLGKHKAIAHTCDFSYDYVKINAEYHT